jgi:hypothetical protein
MSIEIENSQRELHKPSTTAKTAAMNPSTYAEAASSVWKEMDGSHPCAKFDPIENMATSPTSKRQRCRHLQLGIQFFQGKTRCEKIRSNLWRRLHSASVAKLDSLGIHTPRTHHAIENLDVHRIDMVLAFPAGKITVIEHPEGFD